MMFDGYKLSERAAQAALGVTPVPPREPMRIDLRALAMAKHAPKEPSPMEMTPDQIYAPPVFVEGTLPAGMAMDACMPAAAGDIRAWASQALFHEGQGFFGFPLLAELMQRAEYRHACQIWAEHAVRKWIKLVGGNDERRKKIEEEFERLEVRDTFETWFMHDLGFGRGQMFLDFGDADKDAELSTPLRMSPNKISPSRPLQSLNLVEPMWSAPGIYSTQNPLRRDFYKPQEWLIYGRRVHHSRILTITSRPVSDMLKPSYAFGGQSLIQIMKPYVDNWLRTRQAVSDLINAFSILVLKTDMSATMAGGCGDDIFNRLDLFNALRDNRGSMAIDKESEELESIAVPLSGLDSLQAQAQEQLASASRIPLSIYLQITPTGLNATNDGETRTFYADVHAYQEKNALRPLEKILQAVQLSIDGKIDPELKIEFCPLWEMTDKDKADVRKSDAEADCAYVQNGIIDPEEVRERLANDEAGLYYSVDLTDPAPGYGNEGVDDPKDLKSPKI